jgi:NAD(P)H-flavin reductase
MHTGKGQVVELLLQNGLRCVRISCPTNLIPSAGQYLLAGSASNDPYPVPLFYTDSSSSGFITASPVPAVWNPGQKIYLRGPLGRGFTMPMSARKVALIAFDDSFVRLYGLISRALKQGAAVVLVYDAETDGLPDEVEIQPLSTLDDVLQWADYVAFEVERESLPGLRERLSRQNQLSLKSEAQAFIHTSVPCGGIAECGVCSVVLKSGWKLACKDGPVFDLSEI